MAAALEEPFEKFRWNISMFACVNSKVMGKRQGHMKKAIQFREVCCSSLAREDDNSRGSEQIARFHEHQEFTTASHIASQVVSSQGVSTIARCASPTVPTPAAALARDNTSILPNGGTAF